MVELTRSRSSSERVAPEEPAAPAIDDASQGLLGENADEVANAANGLEHGEQPISGYINFEVRSAVLAQFEEWLEEIGTECEQFPGYLDRDVVRSAATGDSIPVSVLLKFASAASFYRWETSEERQHMLCKAI